ncbi:soluble guanylate cyclase gcy-31-like [Babylonia areolata]|uniref:soluble guanylate cyclase gcy-31-like n=1 Tax=Babylonia areolata TaxID=304850 RepID=UPI003FD67C0B
MYGLLIEAIGHIITKHYGEDVWGEISRRAGMATMSFATHTVYPEDFIPRISTAAASVLQVRSDDVMYEFGIGFVFFISQYGYDNILRAGSGCGVPVPTPLFQKGTVQNTSAPRPNIKCGQKIVQQGTGFFSITRHEESRRPSLGIRKKLRLTNLITRAETPGTNTPAPYHKVLQQRNPASPRIRIESKGNGPLDESDVHPKAISRFGQTNKRAQVLFDLFPFHVVFDQTMAIQNVGSALAAVIPQIVGHQLDHVFFQARPLTTFCWDEVLAHTNNVFELVTRNELKKSSPSQNMKNKPPRQNNNLHLKGQMVYMPEWRAIMFLGTPIMQCLKDMLKAGLYINDLSMHDCSRDLVLASTQQSAELKLALAQEQQKSQLLTASMKKLDEEIRTTDEFVYQMIPKPVADRLRQGESAVNTCQSFDCVTILFSDVVGFTTICSRITPMEVVSMLNAMYTSFDRLSENHCVYKVETIGDAYMAVAGAPTVTTDHAESMCDMALDMLAAMPDLKDPSSNDSMKIRIGIHTGSTVAGVVGLKMPRYCLFGDTVNTASRMESNGEAMKIHISETTRQKLTDTPYVVKDRGFVVIKGKGSMKTYWLEGRDGKSVREKKEQETGRKTPPSTTKVVDPESVETDSHFITSLPSHRHIYSPVSFDDLTHDQGHSHSPDSISSSFGKAGGVGGGVGVGGRDVGMVVRRPRKVSISCLERRVSGASTERRVSSPSTTPALVSDLFAAGGMVRKSICGVCPAENEVSGLPCPHSSPREQSGEVSGLPCPHSSPREQSGEVSGLFSGGPVPSGVSLLESAAAVVAGTPGTSVNPDSAACTSPVTGQGFTSTHTVQQLPTCSESHAASPREESGGRRPDRVGLQGGSSSGSEHDNNLDHNNPPPPAAPQRPGSDPHPHNNSNNSGGSNNVSSSSNDHSNNNDKCSPVQSIQQPEDGPSSIHTLRHDVVNDSASSPQTSTGSGPSTARDSRNGRARGLKQKAERSMSNPGRHKYINSQKSRSKACGIL